MIVPPQCALPFVTWRSTAAPRPRTSGNGTHARYASNHVYKQVRPSAALASLRALRPAYMEGLSERSVVEMCVTMDSAIGSVLPRFRGL